MKNEERNKKQESELTDKSKSNKSDISNSLERDATDTPLTQKQTPQGRTDIEMDQENEKKKQQ